MGAGAPVLAYDVEFNREVTANTALFWPDADALIAIFNQISNHELDAKLAELPAIEKQRIQDAYKWDAVTDDYEKLANKMLADKGKKPKAKKGKGTSGTKASS
jgi:glycosyltransferase involved in cell wall biosynthesis